MERNADNPSKVFLKLDFSNAFNCIDRGVFLREVRGRLPALSKWVEWCYTCPSRLLFDGAVISSEVGCLLGK